MCIVKIIGRTDGYIVNALRLGTTAQFFQVAVEALKLANYTRAVGGSIAAAEFMNEPTFPDMGTQIRSAAGHRIDGHGYSEEAATGARIVPPSQPPRRYP